MRKAALLAIPLFLSGCSGLGKFVQDTATLPGDNPNIPEGQSENLEKVKGHTYVAMPILPENGNIWPGAPQPLPTLRDVVASPNGLRDALSDTNSYFGSMTKGLDAGGSQLGDGGSLAIGEHDGIVNGVRSTQRPSLLPLLRIMLINLFHLHAVARSSSLMAMVRAHRLTLTVQCGLSRINPLPIKHYGL